MITKISETIPNVNPSFGNGKLIQNSKIIKIKQLAQQGMSIPMIARECELTRSTVQMCLEKCNIVTVVQKALKNVKKETLQGFVNLGYSNGEIAKILGIDMLTVDKLFKKYKLESINSAVNKAVAEYIKDPTQENKARALSTIDIHLKKSARTEVLKNETCSYDDYLQSLRLEFLEKLEECRNDDIMQQRIVSEVRSHKPHGDMFFGKEHPVMELMNTEELYAEDKAFISMENDSYNSKIINMLLGELTGMQRKLINSRFGLCDDNVAIRNMEMSINELSKRFCYTPERIRALIKKAINNMREILDKKPKTKEMLADTILKDSEHISR